MREIHETISDVDGIARIYLAFVDCGRMDDVFYAGHDLLYFLNLFNEKKNWVCTIDNIPVGFGIVNEYGPNWRRAEASFAFLPSCSARDAVEFGKMMIKALFESEVRLEYVYGTTPSRNETAVKFAKMIGMREVARTPNYLDYKGEADDAVITYIERETALAIRPRETEDSK